MRILIYHFHYKTPYQGGAIRSWYLSTHLKTMGIACEVITTHNKSSYQRLEIDGVPIHYLPVKYESHFGFLRRLFAFWKYNRLAWFLSKKLQKPDLVYAISTPLTIGLLARKLKKKKGWDYIFEIGDNWPEAPIQMGVLKSKFLISKTQEMEKKVYQEATGIVPLSPPIEDHVKNIVPEANTLVIPNFSDITFFSKVSKGSYLEFFDPSRIIITYFGAIGKANALEHFLNTAKYLEDKAKNIGFVMMGNGSEKERLEQEYGELSNLIILDNAPRPYVRDVLHSSDFIYISYHQIPVLETGSPNKFFDALASGVPVITNFGGWITDLIINNDCGYSVKPDEYDELLTWISEVSADESKMTTLKENARELAESFKPDSQVKKLSEWLATTADIPKKVSV